VVESGNISSEGAIGDVSAAVDVSSLHEYAVLSLSILDGALKSVLAGL